MKSYVYLFRVDGIVVYVGKGVNSRDRQHLWTAMQINIGSYKGRVSRWHSFLAKRVREGSEIAIDRVADGLTETEAFKLEIQLIQEYGRRDIDPGGTLRNLLRGGDGVTSEDAKRMARTLANREAQRDRANALWSDPAYRAKHKAACLKVLADPTHREELKAARRKQAENPLWLAAVTAANRKRALDPKQRSITEAAARRTAKDPSWRSAVTAANKRKAQDPAWQAAHKASWTDERRAKHTATCAKRREARPI